MGSLSVASFYSYVRLVVTENEDLYGPGFVMTHAGEQVEKHDGLWENHLQKVKADTNGGRERQKMK